MNRKAYDTQLAEAMEGWGSPFERANILATGVERLTKERDDLLALLGARKMGVDKLHAENSELRKQLADAIRSVIIARDMLDPGGDLSLKDALFALGEHIEIGKRWRANNSLEEWFPFSAQKLKSLETECGNAAAIIVKQNQELDQLRSTLGDVLRDCHSIWMDTPAVKKAQDMYERKQPNVQSSGTRDQRS